MDVSEITEHVSPIIGLQLAIVNRAADMRVFQFGTIRAIGGSTFADFALHIQCPWRIEHRQRIITGRSDLWEPADTAASIDWDTWDYETGVNLQDAILRRLLADSDSTNRIISNQTNSFFVEAVLADAVGGITITFADGYRLVAFPAGVRGEHWRFFQPKTDHPHLVSEGEIVSLHGGEE